MKPENKIQIIAESRTFLGDLQTPVGIYVIEIQDYIHMDIVFLYILNCQFKSDKLLMNH